MSSKNVLKRCNQCLEFLPLSEFHSSSGTLDGYQGKCKDCIHDYKINQKTLKNLSKERRSHWIPNIKLVGYARTQTYQHECLACKALFFCGLKDRRLEDLFCEDCDIKERLLKDENTSEYYHLGNIKGWVVKFASDSNKRSYRNYKKVYKRDEYTCRYCGYNIETAKVFHPLHIDHINPHAASGNNSMENLVVACSPCNKIASDKIFYDFDTKKEFILNKKMRNDL